MKAVFVDTSFVIALLNSSDQYHAKACELAAVLASNNRPRITTTAVLLELGDGFARKGRWQLIAPVLAAAAKDSLLEIMAVDASLAERGSSLRNSRLDKDWGLTDCVSFVVMSDRGLDEALTADRHFQQAGFRALLCEPHATVQP